MYPSIIREGERVLTPSGRSWVVVGWDVSEPQRIVALVATDGSGEELSIHPRYLRLADGRQAGELLTNIGYGFKTL